MVPLSRRVLEMLIFFVWCWNLINLGMEYYVHQKLWLALVTLWHLKILKGCFTKKVWKLLVKINPGGITATIPMPNKPVIIQSITLATIPTYGKTSSTLRRWENSTAVVCFCWRVYLHTICHLSEKRKGNVLHVHEELREASDHLWLKREIGQHGSCYVIKQVRINYI